MAGPPSYPDTDTTGQGSGPRSARPRWKAAAIVIAVIALLAVMVILAPDRYPRRGTHG
jgi:hypothetical protein